MSQKKYNVWFKPQQHWTKYTLDTCNIRNMGPPTENPIPLSKEDALKLLGMIEDLNTWRKNSYEVRQISSRKIIPAFPLDPNLPILMAAHLQDRQRKRS